MNKLGSKIAAYLLEETTDDRVLFVIEFGPAQLPNSLTTAQRNVALLVLAGRSRTEIARMRRTSLRTVANQLTAVFVKCGVASQSELIARFGRGVEAARDA